MNKSQMPIAFLAFGASVSSMVAWRFADQSFGERSHDSCLHLSADGAFLKPLRVLSAVQLVGTGRRRRISAKQRGAKKRSLYLGNVWRKKAG